MTRKKKLEMEIVNHNAAGIDVGSRSHYLAVGQALEDVKEFSVYDVPSYAQLFLLIISIWIIQLWYSSNMVKIL